MNLFLLKKVPGVIIKDRVTMSHYRLLIKSDKVSEKHERMYDSFSVYNNKFIGVK